LHRARTETKGAVDDGAVNRRWIVRICELEATGIGGAPLNGLDALYPREVFWLGPVVKQVLRTGGR
jgi:hypothetical protein